MPRSRRTAGWAGCLVSVLALTSVVPTGATGADVPIAGLRTEAVEPGVFRVIGDAFRDLPTDTGWRVEAGRDGSVWLLSEDEARGLGHERSIAWPEGEWQADLRRWRATPEGGVIGWTSNADEEWFVASLDEPDTEPRIVPMVDGLEPYAAMPDGRAWAHGLEDAEGTSYALWRLTDGEWLEVATGLDVAGPQVSADGDLWLGSGFLPFASPELRSLKDDDWVRYPAPRRTPNEGWTVGPDGSVWTWANYRIKTPDSAFLARMKEGDWLSWDREDLPAFADMQAGIDTAVAPDGALWIAALVWVRAGPDLARRCRGVSRFDGDTLTTYLEDHCVLSLSIGPDGSVWLRARKAGSHYTRSDGEPVDTYLIPPAATNGGG